MGEEYIRVIIFLNELIKIFLIIHVFMNVSLREKAKIWLVYLIPAALVVELTAITLGVARGGMNWIELILSLILLHIIFLERYIKKLVFYFISFLSIVIFDSVVYFIVTRVTGYSLGQIYSRNSYMVWIDLISLFLELVIILILKMLRRRCSIPIGKLSWKSYILVLVILFLLLFFTGYLQVLEGQENQRVENIFIFIIGAAVISIFSLIIIMLRASYARDNYKAISQMQQENIEIQQRYYALLTEKNEDIRKFRHDIKNHLICMHALVQNGEIGELTNYIGDLTDRMGEITNSLYTGSNIVDAILNDIIIRHPKANITLEGCLPKPLHIKASDLCIIFSNLATNAVEAVEKIEEPDQRKINLSIKSIDNKIYVHIVNSIARPYVIVNNTLKTTKTDKQRHGFGIENIKSCVAKYHGMMNLSNTEQEFAVEIMIKNETYDRSP